MCQRNSCHVSMNICCLELWAKPHSDKSSNSRASTTKKHLPASAQQTRIHWMTIDFLVGEETAKNDDEVCLNQPAADGKTRSCREVTQIFLYFLSPKRFLEWINLQGSTERGNIYPRGVPKISKVKSSNIRRSRSHNDAACKVGLGTLLPSAWRTTVLFQVFNKSSTLAKCLPPSLSLMTLGPTQLKNIVSPEGRIEQEEVGKQLCEFVCIVTSRPQLIDISSETAALLTS